MNLSIPFRNVIVFCGKNKLDVQLDVNHFQHKIYIHNAPIILLLCK